MAKVRLVWAAMTSAWDTKNPLFASEFQPHWRLVECDYGQLVHGTPESFGVRHKVLQFGPAWCCDAVPGKIYAGPSELAKKLLCLGVHVAVLVGLPGRCSIAGE